MVKIRFGISSELSADLVPYCLQYWLLKNISRREGQTTSCD